MLQMADFFAPDRGPSTCLKSLPNPVGKARGFRTAESVLGSDGRECSCGRCISLIICQSHARFSAT